MNEETARKIEAMKPDGFSALANEVVAQKYAGRNVVMMHDLVNRSTGKTYREENLELQHNIPIGTLVEFKGDDWFGDGGSWKFHARMWVVSHYRDCDGTPLYAMSRWRDVMQTQHGKRFWPSGVLHGFSENALTIVPITPELLEGYGALEYEEVDSETA